MNMKKNMVLAAALLASVALSSNTHALPISVTSDGFFDNATGGPGLVTTGEGTANFTWGIGVNGSGPSSLDFTSESYVGETDDIFSFGTLDYFNGTIAGNSGADAVDLNVSLSFTNPTGIDSTFDYNLQLINSPNTSDPIASADMVFLPGTVPDNSFSFDGVDYTLEFIGFGTVDSVNGFVALDSFNVLEGKNAGVQLLGRVTEFVPPVTETPLPASILLLASGLFGLGSLRKKKKLAAS